MKKGNYRFVRGEEGNDGYRSALDRESTSVKKGASSRITDGVGMEGLA